jgi:hypothetical protein
MQDGLLVALAYPDEFVRATEGRYNSILEKVGIVHKGLVCAGHAAGLLIHKESGKVIYGDFGRYITPEGKGRARTFLTDPDVDIELHAQFDSNGACENLEDLLIYIRNREDITHSEGDLFAGCFDVDFQKTWAYMSGMSCLGSIDYGPFTLKGSNCARFIWKAAVIGRSDPLFTAKMMFRFLPTIMPLDIVMAAGHGRRFVVTSEGMKEFRMGQWPIWMYLFRRPGFGGKSKDWVQPPVRGNWVDGIGDAAYFSMGSFNKETMMVQRFDQRGRLVFSLPYSMPDGFDPQNPFDFIHDCTAMSCTLLQDGHTFHAYRVHDSGAESRIIPFHQVLSINAEFRS